jgi:hypothetical protein
MDNQIKCPGQDTRYWTFEDIFEVSCPKCKSTIEFFKDDPSRTCDNCQSHVTNPKLDLGCKKHCSMADSCTVHD